jgi:hypothetical protein
MMRVPSLRQCHRGEYARNPLVICDFAHTGSCPSPCMS